MCLTQGRVISIATVEKNRVEGNWNINIEWTKATFCWSRNHKGNIWVHCGLEGNLDFIWQREGRINTEQQRSMASKHFEFNKQGCSPVSDCTLPFSVLMSCHKKVILSKISSSNWSMSLAAQQQPRCWLKVQLQSDVSQVRAPFQLTGKNRGTPRRANRYGFSRQTKVTKLNVI